MNISIDEEEGLPLLPAVKKVRRTLKSTLHEFRTFIDRGNIFDLAIGVVIGNAFSEIVNSFVGDIFSPLIGLIVSSKLSETFIVLKKGPHYPYNTREEAKEDAAVTWNYGNFLQMILNFMIISASLFIVMKMFERMRRKKIEEDALSKHEISTIFCPMCYSEIDERSKKCKECTADLTQ